MILMTATIAAAAGQIMATALGAPGPGRFAAAEAVVRADPTVVIGHGDNADKVDVLRSALLPAAAVARVAAVPGVRVAVGDVAFPLTVIGRDGAPLPARGGGPARGHGWQSAALTPYRLAVGRAPASPDEVVLDVDLARAGGFRVGGRVRIVSPAGMDALAAMDGGRPPPARATSTQSACTRCAADSARLARALAGGWRRVPGRLGGVERAVPRRCGRRGDRARRGADRHAGDESRWVRPWSSRNTSVETTPAAVAPGSFAAGGRRHVVTLATAMSSP